MVRFIGRMVAVCVVAGAVAVGANAVSPVGISWFPRQGESIVTDETLLQAAAITPQDVAELLDAGMAIVVDARPAEPYSAGHLPGAINVPGQELFEGNAELAEPLLMMLPPPEALAPMQVVIYCEGATCSDSLLVFDHFSQLGYRRSLRVMLDGWEAWVAAGLAVEEGQP